MIASAGRGVVLWRKCIPRRLGSAGKRYLTRLYSDRFVNVEPLLIESSLSEKAPSLWQRGKAKISPKKRWILLSLLPFGKAGAGVPRSFAALQRRSPVEHQYLYELVTEPIEVVLVDVVC